MKKTLLSLGLAVMAFGATAQLNGTGDGFTMDNLDATSQCLINAGLPNNGGIMNNDGASFASSCTSLYGTSTGVDLTSQSRVTFIVSSDTQGAELEVYLGGEGEWNPATSTYNTGSGSTIDAIHTFAAADGDEMLPGLHLTCYNWFRNVGFMF